MNTRLKTYF